MFNQIVVPVDFAHASTAGRVVATARANLKEGGHLLLIHVLEPLPAVVAGQLSKELLDNRDKEAEASMKAMVADLSLPPNTKLVIETGRPWRVIVEHITDPVNQAIVMAGHSPKFSDVLLGSVASQVVRHAPCSVMVLRGLK